MKKNHLLAALAALALVSCQKETAEIIPVETPAEEPKTENPVKVVFDLEINSPDDPAAPGTKAVKTGWEPGDVVYVGLRTSNSGIILTMTRTASSWEYTYKPAYEANLQAIASSDSGDAGAVYMPFGAQSEPTDYSFYYSSYRDQLVFPDNDGYYSYHMTASGKFTTEVDEDNNVVIRAALNMKIPEGYVQFFVEETAADNPLTTQMELRNRNLQPCGLGRRNIVAGESTYYEEALGAPLKGYYYKKTGDAKGGWLFSGILAPEARNTPTDYHFTLVKRNEGQETVYLRQSRLARTYYRGESEGRAMKITGTWVPHEYIPLDLKTEIWISSTLRRRIYWADRNLGAATPQDFGHYYAWGETEPYYDSYTVTESDADYGCRRVRLNLKTEKPKGYDWNSYKHSNGIVMDKEYYDRYRREITDNNYNSGSWSMETGTNPVYKRDSLLLYGITKYGYYESTWAGEGTRDYKGVLDPEDDAAHVNMGLDWRMPTEDEVKKVFYWGNESETEGGYKLGRGYGNYDTMFVPYAGGAVGSVVFSFGGCLGGFWTSTKRGWTTIDVSDKENTFYNGRSNYAVAVNYVREFTIQTIEGERTCPPANPKDDYLRECCVCDGFPVRAITE